MKKHLELSETETMLRNLMGGVRRGRYWEKRDVCEQDFC